MTDMKERKQKDSTVVNVNQKQRSLRKLKYYNYSRTDHKVKQMV